MTSVITLRHSPCYSGGTQSSSLTRSPFVGPGIFFTLSLSPSLPCLPVQHTSHCPPLPLFFPPISSFLTLALTLLSNASLLSSFPPTSLHLSHFSNHKSTLSVPILSLFAPLSIHSRLPLPPIAAIAFSEAIPARQQESSHVIILPRPHHSLHPTTFIHPPNSITLTI